MEPDIRDLLKKNLELTKENNKILKKMRRSALFGTIIKLVWLAVLIGLPVYIYFQFLEPVVGNVLDAAQTVQEVGDKVQGVEEQLGGSLDEIRGFLNR
ncbi:MAG: hypothetical protein WD509_01895 [Candidatus Paceibacterota bacterium]